MQFQNIPVPIQTSLMSLINSQQSKLLSALYLSFDGQPGATIALGPGYGTHADSSNNTITVGEFSLPGSGFSGSFTNAQLGAALAHEMSHLVLPGGSGVGLTTASTPDASELIGETAEGEAYLAEYVVARQLGLSTDIMQAMFGQKLLNVLTQDAQGSGLNVASITDIGSLTASNFYQQNILNVGQVVATLKPSDSLDPKFTYRSNWDDAWVLQKVYNLPFNFTDFNALSASAIVVTKLPGGGWSFTGNNISLLEGTSGIGTITVANATFNFQASETADGQISQGVWSVLTPTTASINGGTESDVLYGYAGRTNSFKINIGNNTATHPIETIVSTGSGSGSIQLQGFVLGSQPLTQTAAERWTDGTYNYQFVSWNQISPGDFPSVGYAAQHNDLDISPSVGELVITGSPSGRPVTINVLGFDLQQAEAGGFLGIGLPEQLSFNVTANDGHDPPATSFLGGSSESFTLSVDAPATVAQNLTVTLGGALPADFEVQVGDQIESLSPSGTFNFTLAPGDTNVAFTLIDTTADNGSSDIAGGATLTLSGSLADPHVSGGVVQTTSITLNYVPEPVEPLDHGSGVDITGSLDNGDTFTYDDASGNPVTVGGAGDPFYLYSDDTYSGVGVLGTDAHPNWIEVSGLSSLATGTAEFNYVSAGDGVTAVYLNGAHDYAVIGDGVGTVHGGTGMDTITTLNANTVIDGDGGTDLIFAGQGTNQVYAGQQVGLAAAIGQTQGAGRTTGRGDFIGVLDGNNTVVGGTGDDLITAGVGQDEIVLGSGDDTFVGGWDVTFADTNWDATVVSNGRGGSALEVDNVVTEFTPPYSNPFLQPYNGSYDPNSGQPLSVSNDTIFAGNGNDLIVLGNGGNYVQGGSGNDSIYGGMGADTIYIGSGNDFVAGGGGETYIYGGSGHDTLRGGDGDNTIIGGSGNSTITAAHGPSATYAGISDEQNYVFGGSGNDLITGSAGNDTLIAGSGNTTILGGAGNESIVGGSGADSLVAGMGNATIEAGGAGNDTLLGGNNSTGTYSIYGGGGVDSIVGGSGTNVLVAGDGGTGTAATTVQAGLASVDTIFGGDGVDLLIGGAGSNLIYGGDGGTSTAPTTILAGSGASTLYGGSGTELIQGGAGTDVIYAGDSGPNAGPTTVTAGSGTATLYGGAGSALLEDLQSGTDLIQSRGANDTLVGVGADTLVAGAGSDVMQGVGGSVTFEIDAGAGDVSLSASGGGANLVFGPGIVESDVLGGISVDSSGTAYLTLNYGSGTVAIAGALTGGLASVIFLDPAEPSVGTLLNEVVGADQVIPVGAANFVLSLGVAETVTAGAGSDTISSWGSNSVLFGGTSSSNPDLIFSAADSASIVGGTGVDSIEAQGDHSSVLGGAHGTYVTLSGAGSSFAGTNGQDFITLSGSNDTAVAGNGNTVFTVNDLSALIEVTAGSAVDSVFSSVSYTAPTNVNILTLIGSSAVVATGNAGNDVLTGGAGNDTLVAGAGVDTLVAGTGSTTFVIDNTGDVVVGRAGTTGQIDSSVSYSLPGNVNTLVLTGTTNLLATANSGNDTLVSNGGVDTLVGGSGNDTFIINNPGDVIEAGSGTITLIDQFSGNYSLSGGAALLTLTGTANLVATAGSGNDTLVSNSGVDTLYGGAGNDTFVINNSADVVVDTSSTTSNTVQSSVSYSLPGDINTLILTGSAAVVGSGNVGNDVLYANSGNDTLISGTSLTTLVGGSGNDAFFLNNAGDVVSQGVTGVSDTIFSSVSATSAVNIDTLVLTGTANLTATVGNPDNDTLVSNSGVDTFIGGSGNEVYLINNSGDVVQDSSAAEGSIVEASVSYTLPNFVTSLILTGTANLTGVANNDTDDVLTGNAGHDILQGGVGYDTLVAGSGSDTLEGGLAPTTFVVNNTADVVTSTTGAPDTIESSVSYTLPAGVGTLVLTGSANLTGAALSGNNSIVGNSGNDVLAAGTGHDTLVAGSGADTLIGGTGPDTFVVNSSADVVESVSGATGNRVFASINYTLPVSIDILTLTGTAGLLAVGNAAADSIIGNFGSDTLIAGSGIDTLVAGQGPDLFVVNNSADVVSVPAGLPEYGTDTIQSSVSFTLPTDVTVLQLTGTANLSGTGNAGGGEIIGNGGNDTLRAGPGNSTLVAGTGLATLIGATGNNFFVIDNTADVVDESVSGSTNTLVSSVSYTLPVNVDVLTLTGSGGLVATGNSDNDSMIGNAGADTLIAGSGMDTLVAGSGVDTFIAGSGGDVFKVNNTADVIESATATALNAVVASVSFVLPTNVNALTFTGVGNDVGTGNAGNDVITGNAGSDTLIAGTGIATLVGGSGSMDFVVNNTADVVTDSYAIFASQIQSSVNYVLPTNVNTLILTGTGSLVGTANSSTDTLISNAGTDTLVGGTGADTFVVNNSGDVIQVSAANAGDLVLSAVSYSLVGGVNSLYLTGTANLLAAANNGNDTLSSNSGIDTLIGGTGNDTFIVSNAADVVEDSAAAATNSIVSSVSYSLPTDVNLLTLTGTASLIATGNSGADRMQANSGNDTLVAGTGAATLVGGVGNDLFVVNNSADVVQVSATGVSDTIDSSVSFTLPTTTGLLQLTGTANLLAKASSGNDTLISNTGVDTLVAGAGPDLIIINNPGDVVQSVTAGDTIESSGNFTLNVAGDLLLLGTAALTATGNVAGDILTAGAGNDTLVANSANQTLIGGSGNDTFVVSDPSDVVIDTASTTSNVMLSSVSYTLPAEVDTLTLTGTAAATVAGNQDLDNVITGNSGYDEIVGTAYNNTLTGGNPSYYGQGQIYGGPGTNVIYAGNGVFEYVYGNSSVVGATPQNTLYGGSQDDYLYGGQGSDLIETGSGYNTVFGGSGADTIYGTSGHNTLIAGSGSSLIYGGATTSLIEGGSGSSTLYGGSGVGVIDAGAGLNVIYVGSGGISSNPFSVQGGATGTTSGTRTTIYGGSGVDDLYGGPGSDAIYAGTGTQYLFAGTGADTLYGYGSGNLLIDNNGGRSLLVGGAGAETLVGGGGDTLVAGTGSDVLYDSAASVTGSVYEFNPGFGRATVGAGASRNDTVATSLNDTLAFGAGINTADLSISQSVVGSYYSLDSLALIINEGSSSIEVDAGIVPGTLNTVEIGGITESFTQFMNAAGPGMETVGSGGLTSELSTGNGQTLTDANSTVWWSVWAFGNGDVINDVASSAPEGIYAYGNNDTVSAFGGWFGGNNDLIQLSAETVYGASPVTIAGANDTVTTASNSFGDIDFIVSATSDVIDVVTLGQFADSIDAYASFSLPTNVGYLTLDSKVGGLSASSNAQGGDLIAGGSNDTLTGGAGHDTLYAQGSNDVLIGGSGSETYILTSTTETVGFGSGAASITTVDVNFSYTLPTAANSLVEMGYGAIAIGNTANDFIEASGTLDTIVAGGGNDTLQAAGTANVTLIGGSGTDTFWVAHTGDVIVDTAPAANDALIASVSYSLPSFIDVMTVTGTGSIVATANNANDSISANAGHDTVIAGVGNDTLVAGTQADTFEINSGFGADLIENANSGDIIQFGAGISLSSLTFSALAGTAGAAPSLVISGDGGSITVQGGLVPGAVSAINFSGGTSETVPQLVAPSGPVTIAGSGGNLILLPSSSAAVTGGSGDDTIVGWGSADTLVAGTGGALLYAGGANDVAAGSSASDTLVALGSGDTLDGGPGTETFIITNSSTVVQAVAGSQDTLLSSVGYTLPANVATLILTGTANLQATGNAGSDVIVANSGTDTLIGGSGAATLVGGSGTDTFVVTNTGDVIQNPAGGLLDVVVAQVNFTLPTGINTLNVSASNVASTGNAQNDTLVESGNYDTITAGNGTNTMAATGQRDVLIAGSGNDVLSSADGFSSLISGSGVDTLYSTWEYDTLVINNSADVIASVAAFDSISSSVSYTIPQNLPSDSPQGFWFGLTGTANLTVTDLSSLPDTLSTNSGNDLLIGGPGFNEFVDISGGGVNTFVGGSGSNEFEMFNPNDVIVVQPGSTNRLDAVSSVTLAPYIDTLFLTGTGHYGVANSDNDTLIGNFVTLYGGSGNDSFSSSGSVTMVAGSGSDTITSLNDGDAIVLNSGFGAVNVNMSPHGLHSSGPIVEFGTGETASSLTASANATGALTITDGTGTVTLAGGLTSTPYRFEFGSGPLLTTGQFLSEVNLASTSVAGSSGGNVVFDATPATYISGGSGNDVLAVAASSDTLVAGSGAQFLDAYGSADSMVGGTGHDTAVAYGDYDTVVSGSTSSSNLVATIAGANALLMGNAGNDILTAQGVGDTLISGTGVQQLVSSHGLTTFVVNNASDFLLEGSSSPGNVLMTSVSFTLPSLVDTLILTGTASLSGGGNNDNDLLEGNAGSDTLTAGSGMDTLIAGIGAARLVGGAGADLFVINSITDVVTVSGAHGADSIQSSVSFTLPTGVNVLILSGGAALTGGSNASADLIIGNAGADTLSASGTAATTLEGGGGNNVFNVTNTHDVVVENNTGVNDLILSTVSFTLPTNVTALSLSGTGPLLASGGTWGGVLTAASTGTDTLAAGTLVSTLIGGGGNDVFVVNNTADVVTVGTAGLVDSVQSSVSYSSPTNVTKLTFTGTAGVYGVGNSLNDTLTANSGNDTLQAGTGTDVLVGGTGADLFIINSTADTVSVGASHGVDTVQSSVSYSLPTNVSTLILTGTADLNGTGSSLSGGVIQANGGTDVLTGIGGATSLYGGGGNDTFTINNTSDVVVDTYTTTTNTLNSSVSFTLPTHVNILNVTGTSAVRAVGNGGNDSITANNAADTLVAGSGNDTLVAGTAGADSLVGGTGTDLFVVKSTADIVSVSTANTNDTIQSSVSYVLPANVQYLTLTGTGAVSGTGNGITDLIVANTGTDTLSGGTGIAVLEGGSGHDTLRAASNQAALIAGTGSTSLSGGAFRDFLAAGSGSDTILAGATANVVAVNKGDGATALSPTTGASDVLSLGAGIDTEALTFTKTGNNLILNDGVSGDSLTFTNWYSSTNNQNVKTLQVVEIASTSYNGSSTDPLRNRALEDFNFSTLVAAFNTASSPANWALSNAMSTAQLSSTSAAYGGDLAYYFGLNGNLTGLDLSAAQSTLTNSSFATAAQTVDSWSSISGGSGLHLLIARPPVSGEPLAHIGPTEPPIYVDPTQVAWLNADASAQESNPLLGSEVDTVAQNETAALLPLAVTSAGRRTIDTPRSHRE